MDGRKAAGAPNLAPAYSGPRRILSGIQASGALHLGNYLGALRRFGAMQDTHATIYCIVDMHAITVWQEPEKLRQATRELAAALQMHYVFATEFIELPRPGGAGGTIDVTCEHGNAILSRWPLGNVGWKFHDENIIWYTPPDPISIDSVASHPNRRV